MSNDEKDSLQFMDLPTELLLQILGQLSYKDILRCRQSCKHLDTITRTDANILYKIQLGLNGLQDGPSTSLKVHDRLRILAEYQAGWDDLRFGPMRIVAMSTHGVWELVRNVLAQRNRNSLVFVQLPSAVRGIDERLWTLDSIQRDIRDFAMDPTQNLLCILETSQTEVHIHLRTLNAGDAHPLASNARISYVQEISYWSYSIRICSGYLAILFPASPVSNLCVWNWTSGRLHLEISGQILAYSFLTDHHIVLIRRHSAAELLVIDLRSVSPKGTPVDEVDYICSFRFPALKPDATVDYGEIRSDPPFSFSTEHGPATPFHLASGERLFAVFMRGSDSSSVYGSPMFLIPLDSLLPHFYRIPNLAPKLQVEWDKWGPKGTRAIPVSLRHSPVWIRNVYGMRFVDLVTETGGDPYVFVADFNQAAFRKASMNEEYVTGARTMKLVYEDSTLGWPSQMFADPVTTSLPYRWGKVHLPRNYESDNVDYDGAMVSEDAIVVVDCFDKTKYCILSICSALDIQHIVIHQD
ncbi:unnamed protein product [Somion occarium]|uniref:F-box domain-containing protein n=1 Tax=Somion occarium TaxID=3059160 RepID=A0ABP1D6Y3_9APHY